MGLDGVSIDFLINLLANLATAVVLALAAWIVIAWRRKAFARFFGLRSNSSQLHIYLSSIAVRERGSIATQPIVTGFHGETISEHEYRHANRLSAVLAGRASALTMALLGPTVSSAQIASRVTSSPTFRNYPRHLDGEERNSDDLESEVVYTVECRGELENLFSSNGCTVVVGGPRYNILNHYLSTEFPVGSDLAPVYEFYSEPDSSGRLHQGVRPRGSTDHPDHRVRSETEDYILEYFLLEKVVRVGHTVFLCAGTSTIATAASLRALSGWSQIVSEVGDRSFARLYELRIPRVASSHISRELDFNPDTMRVVRVR